jgi:hypothetical protein
MKNDARGGIPEARFVSSAFQSAAVLVGDADLAARSSSMPITWNRFARRHESGRVYSGASGRDYNLDLR